jgi:hypothetical protein
VCVFFSEFVFVCSVFHSFFSLGEGICLHPLLLSSLPLVRLGSLQRGPLICGGRLYLKRNFLFSLY